MEEEDGKKERRDFLRKRVNKGNNRKEKSY